MKEMSERGLERIERQSGRLERKREKVEIAGIRE